MSNTEVLVLLAVVGATFGAAWGAVVFGKWRARRLRDAGWAKAVPGGERWQRQLGEHTVTLGSESLALAGGCKLLVFRDHLPTSPMRADDVLHLHRKHPNLKQGGVGFTLDPAWSLESRERRLTALKAWSNNVPESLEVLQDEQTQQAIAQAADPVRRVIDIRLAHRHLRVVTLATSSGGAPSDKVLAAVQAVADAFASFEGAEEPDHP